MVFNFEIISALSAKTNPSVRDEFNRDHWLRDNGRAFHFGYADLIHYAFGVPFVTSTGVVLAADLVTLLVRRLFTNSWSRSTPRGRIRPNST